MLINCASYQNGKKIADLILAKKPEGGLEFIQPGYESRAEGTMVLSFCPVKDKDGRGLGAKEPGLAGPAASLPI